MNQYLFCLLTIKLNLNVTKTLSQVQIVQFNLIIPIALCTFLIVHIKSLVNVQTQLEQEKLFKVFLLFY